MFFLRPDGVMGVVPAATYQEDRLCNLFESQVHYVRRRLNPDLDSNYSLISPAYAHGLMFGEAVELYVTGRSTAVLCRVNIH